MHPSRLLKSTPLRLAITFAVLFVASFLVAGAAAYLTVRDNLSHRLDRQISDTFDGFQALYEKADTTDLISAIDRMARASTEHDRIYLIQSATGAILAGNITAAPPDIGWATVNAPVLGVAEDDLRFRIYAADIGDLRVTVGASLEESAEILETAWASFTWATMAVLVFAIGGGAFLAFRAQRRIELIAGTMNALGEGRLDARIPLTRAGDDLDDLSAQINAALDRLKNLIESMRQVSSDIAHDLKTPINRLYIAIEAALDQALRGKVETEALKDALAAARQINDTFDALLRISQIEAGARRSRFSEVDLLGVLDTVLDAYGLVAEERGQSLSLARPDGGPILVFGDRELLLQLFANLIENAIRHSPSGTPIRVEVCRSAERGGPTVIVSDRGPGIPATEREKVFQRLYRLDKSRSTAGSGLGLSLVKAIADLHDASLTLSDNSPGLRASTIFPQRRRPGDATHS